MSSENTRAERSNDNVCPRYIEYIDIAGARTVRQETVRRETVKKREAAADEIIQPQK